MRNFCIFPLLLLAIVHLANGEDSTSAGKPKLRIVTILSPPYTYVKQVEGKKEYYGFMPDLIHRICKQLGYTYEFYEVADGRYGSFSGDKWTGMIGDLIKREKNETGGADLAAAPITITSAREEVVDFINPFQHLTLSILVRKPYHNAYIGQDIWHESFQVLYPLTAPVWAFCVLAFFIVSGLLWIVNRINPYEWGNRYDLGRATEERGEAFKIGGALWFCFTTLQWQGYEFAPRSIAGRILSCFWFSFVTLSLLTYTGALMNHLFWASTVHGNDVMAPPFRSLEELIMSDEYSYGVIRGGSTYVYLTEKALQGAEILRMREYWNSDDGKNQLVKSYQEGTDRVLNVTGNKYAFIGESMMVKHTVNQYCNLMEVPTTFGRRAFGMAVPINMDKKLLDDLHKIILEMTEEGDIEALEQKWWVDKGLCWNVTKLESIIQARAKLEINKPKRVDLTMFRGPLLILLFGIIVSVLALVGEVFFFKYKGRYAATNRPGGQQLKLEEDLS